MATTNEKLINVLNNLVEINNDRVEGYSRASKETDAPDLKNLFTQFIETSRKCRQELVNEVRRLGGTPKEGTSASGKFYRAWMDVKAALTKKDEKAVLSSCEFGEDVAVQAYVDALKEDELNAAPNLRGLVSKQHDLIKADHDKVRTLRDTLVQA